ncbi:MAG: carboxypeptidase-like regulatory domain-containing protein [Muribaculaceae bacterium]|nr:carboxypeptidase-like regulatory domain-containing protein [Muribaculaceae bacterium]
MQIGLKLYGVIILVFVLISFRVEGQTRTPVVADSITRMPLPGASLFDCKGHVAGVCNANGRMPYISQASYPVTIRCLGFKEKTVTREIMDTIFLQENLTELPEVVVETKQHKILHLLGYVREYSTLTTYTDTVFLFREKMVDYMLTPDDKTRFRGWARPRVLKSKSYYRFTDTEGMDSVSNECNYHFSWSDWIGIASVSQLPPALGKTEYGTDTLCGKYSPTEIWIKNRDRVTINVNVLADTLSRKWVPNLAAFFKDYFDFDNFRVRFNYDNVIKDRISPMELTGYSFNIESEGRGRDMFRFNRPDEPFFVSTYAEVYIIDKEYITLKEAKQWVGAKFNTEEIEIYEPTEAPELQPSILALIERVEGVNPEEIRLKLTPDHRLAEGKFVRRNFGHRVLQLLKDLTGITAVRAHRNMNNHWKDFKKEQIQKNNRQHEEK